MVCQHNSPTVRKGLKLDSIIKKFQRVPLNYVMLKYLNHSAFFAR